MSDQAQKEYAPNLSGIPRNDRILSASSHAGILLWGYGGFFPAMFWSIRRNQSSYTAFQSLQALAYQVISVIVYAVITLVLLIVMVPLSTPLIRALMDGATPDIGSYFLWFIFIGLMLLLAFTFTLLGLTGTIACLLGRNFRYPWIGGWIERQLKQPAFSVDGLPYRDAQERIMAALCHMNVVLVITGILVPFIIWVMERGKSIRLQNEALSSLIWQAAQGIIAALISIVGSLATVFLPWLLYITLEQPGQGISGGMPLYLMGGGLVFLFGLLVGLLVLAFFQVYGLVATTRLLHGKEFFYPLIQKWKKS